MTDYEHAKLERFVNDEGTFNAVKNSLRESFLKPKPNRDIYQLAGVTIAIGLLDEAYKDLEKLKNGKVVEDKKSATPHV